MKFHSYIPAALIAAALLIAPTVQATDSLESQVKRAIDSHPTAAALNLDVRVDGNAIVLEGHADNRQLADEVVVAIAKVPGVTTIVNHIHTG